MICAGTSDAGMTFAAKHCAYNFCSGNGEMNDPRDCADSVARLKACTTAAGTDTKALALTMIIADETDEAAMAKWEHYKAGTDLDALSWSRAQAGADKYAADNSTAGRIRRREPLAQQRLAADRLLRHRGAPARRDVGDRRPGRRHADLRRLRDRRRTVRPAHPAPDAQPPESRRWRRDVDALRARSGATMPPRRPRQDRSSTSSCVNIRKRYGDFTAVDGVSLKVEQGPVRLPAGPVGLRQDHDLALHRRPRGAGRRRHPDRRQGGRPGIRRGSATSP